MTVRDSELSFWNDADDLLSSLYRLGREPIPELRLALRSLCDHPDADVREEALRILATRWKDPEGRSLSLTALREDSAPNVRSAAAIAIAATSVPSTLREDTWTLLAVLRDAGDELEVRGAAYDALVILHQKGAGTGAWPFSSKKRPFDPAQDIDRAWLDEIERMVL